MSVFSLEHSKTTYAADFALYGSAVLGLAAFLLLASPRAQWLQASMLTAAGLGSWTMVEYLLHRFVLHGLQPFKRWHAEHHQHPTALICTPVVFSALLFFTLVFVPALIVGNLWRACAFTLGMLTGYVAYGVTHHAAHHWRADRGWLLHQKHRHALHHHDGHAGHYGVTSGLWDHVFGTARRTGAND